MYPYHRKRAELILDQLRRYPHCENAADRADMRFDAELLAQHLSDIEAGAREPAAPAGPEAMTEAELRLELSELRGAADAVLAYIDTSLPSGREAAFELGRLLKHGVDDLTKRLCLAPSEPAGPHGYAEDLLGITPSGEPAGNTGQCDPQFCMKLDCPHREC